MTESEVKNCPFCGHKASLTLIDKINGAGMFVNRTWLYSVRCNKCSMRTKDCKTAKQALEIWNRRVNDNEKTIYS